MYKITFLFLAVNFMVEALNEADLKKICTNTRLDICGKCSHMIAKGKGERGKSMSHPNLDWKHEVIVGTLTRLNKKIVDKMPTVYAYENCFLSKSG